MGVECLITLWVSVSSSVMRKMDKIIFKVLFSSPNLLWYKKKKKSRWLTLLSECFEQFPVSLEITVDALRPNRILAGDLSFGHLKSVCPLTAYRSHLLSHIIKWAGAQKTTGNDQDVGPSTQRGEERLSGHDVTQLVQQGGVLGGSEWVWLLPRAMS